MSNKKIFNSKKLPVNYIWVKENPISYVTESFQKFLINLEYINIDKKYKIIQVSSSISGEGKSTFITNVAYLLSQKKHKVLLMDLDLRRSQIHKICNVSNDKGITDYLLGRTDLGETIQKNNKLGFDILTSGERTSSVINLLESKKIKELILKLKDQYDYILVDSPPVINVSDALFISKLSDAMIFLLANSVTKRGLVKESINLLKQNKVNVLGVVTNRNDTKKLRYGYGYGYEYEYKE